MSSFIPDILTTIHIEGAERDEALKILEDKHSKGLSYEEITGITDKYYLNKIRNGLIKMSAYIYFRITGIDANGEIVTFDNTRVRLRHCIRCGKWAQLKSPYCHECNEILGRVNHSLKWDNNDGGVLKRMHH